jgi:signal transduction histidine kinase
MRTPLQAILGNVQLAQRRLARGSGDEAPPEVVRNLDNAERTTGKLARLVSELMDLAMLRSGQSLPIESTEFDLVEVARDIAEGHRARTDRHAIDITGTPALRGRWDLGRVERVLNNLVENAVKYSPAGGSVTIDVAEESGAALIEVRDEGIGIPAPELPNIFQPYRRGSNARTLRGIGLGLAGCRAVLEQLGGDLTVESTEGVGSTFRVRLPLKAAGSG